MEEEVFTPEEQAYFESEGETDLEVQAEAVEETPEAPAKPPEGYVPHEALHAERMNRKELQAEFERYKQEASERFQTFEELKAQINEMRESRNHPDPDEDPFGAIQYENQKLREEMNEIKDYQSSQLYEQEQSRQHQELVGRYQFAAQEFAAKTPDFGEAYKYALESQIKEYETLGYSHQDASYIAQQQEMQVVQKAFEDGANPAERIYNYAKLRGFQAPANTKGNADLSAIKQGMEEASPVVDKASSESEPPTLVEEFLNAKDEDVNKLWARMFPEA